MTTNPWEEVSNESMYILEMDKEVITAFNSKSKPEFRFLEDLPPEPFIGNPESAEIFLLGLNPGHSGEEQKFLHTHPNLREALHKNLTHSNIEYPLFFLDPIFEHSPGAKWWLRILKPLLNLDIPNIRKKCANKICELQLLPYHSNRFKHTTLNAKSQEYTVGLLKQAIESRKMIILLRAEKRWLKMLPELANRYVKLNSPQNVVLSSKNMGSAAFEKVLEILNK